MKTNPFLAIGKRRLKTMTEAQIVAEAKRRKYKIYAGMSGVRVCGSPAKHGPDLWMNAANVRLWKLQTGQAA